MVIDRLLPAVVPESALVKRNEKLRDEDQKNARARLSDNTHRAYDCQWRRFVEWCLRRGYRSTIPVPPETLLEYLTELGSEGKSISLLRTVMAAVAREHVRVHCHESPTQSEVIRDRMKGLVRRRAKDRTHVTRKAEPVTLAQLLALASLPDARLQARVLRDRAILLLGFSAGFRRSELVGLDIGDVRDVEDGSLDVFVYRSKTDQEGKGVTVPVYPTPAEPAVCPVRAWRAWRAVHTAIDGPAFVAVHKHGQPLPRRRLSGQVVAQVVRGAMTRLGETKFYAGHSLRRGCVTNAVKSDVPLLEIADHVRHKNIQTTREYVGSRINKGMRHAMNPKKET